MKNEDWLLSARPLLGIEPANQASALTRIEPEILESIVY